MKKLFLLILFVYSNSYCQDIKFNIESVDVSILRSITLRYSIQNLRLDTIVFIKEFYSQGIESNMLGYPLSGYNTPNLLYFDSKSRIEFEGTGYFNVHYDYVPFFVKLNPGEKKVFYSTTIMQYRDSDWKIYGLMYFSIYSNLVANFKKNYPLIKVEDYLFETVNEIPVIHNFRFTNGFYDLIKDEFTIRIYSQ